MEDGGLGSLIFYIILGVIALAGSFQNKNKKGKAAPKKVVRNEPEAEAWTPPVRTAPTPPRSRPQYIPIEPSMEGRYDDPVAREFSREGRYDDPVARAFSSEGSSAETMAGAFAMEGSIEDSMAAAFATEGVSGIHDIQFKEFIHTEISDSEIGDAPEYNYNIRPGSDILMEGFDLNKAVIYSAVLNRKEYSV